MIMQITNNLTHLLSPDSTPMLKNFHYAQKHPDITTLR